MLKLAAAATVGIVFVLAVAFALQDSDPPQERDVSIKRDRDSGAAVSDSTAVRTVEADTSQTTEDKVRPTPAQDIEDPADEETEESAPMEPIVGNYWEKFFEEHDLYWGPFPGAYDGYRFPWGNKKIDPYIEDPLFNPRGVRLDPEQRDDLQQIVTEAWEEINAARNAISKEYSQIAIATAMEQGGEPPVRTPGGLKKPEPNRPGQKVKIIGVMKGDVHEKYAIRINQGEYASILDLQSKASQTKDYWISQILAYFESL